MGSHGGPWGPGLGGRSGLGWAGPGFAWSWVGLVSVGCGVGCGGGLGGGLGWLGFCGLGEVALLAIEAGNNSKPPCPGLTRGIKTLDMVLDSC